MKKLIYTFIALFITLGSFAQVNSAKEASLLKLMDAKDGSAIFEKIIEHNINALPANKHADFRQVIEKKAIQIKEEAVTFLMNKYSQSDIDEIYAEFTTDGRIDYTPKTLSFIRHWRSYKTRFQKEFKETFMSYQ